MSIFKKSFTISSVTTHYVIKIKPIDLFIYLFESCSELLDKEEIKDIYVSRTLTENPKAEKRFGWENQMPFNTLGEECVSPRAPGEARDGCQQPQEREARGFAVFFFVFFFNTLALCVYSVA